MLRHYNGSKSNHKGLGQREAPCHVDEGGFYQVLPQRLAKFDLQVAPEKAHLKRFSRFYPSRRRAFQFLGFEFYWDRDRNGEPRLRRVTAPNKHKSLLKSFYDWIKQNRRKWLKCFDSHYNTKHLHSSLGFTTPYNYERVAA